MEVQNESLENYLKAIFIISKKKKGGWVSNTEIADLLSVKPSSVTNMLHKLKAQHLIEWKPRKSIRLTSLGRLKATQLIRTYNKLNQLFKKVLKIQNANLIKRLSCGIEHHITPEVSTALDDLLLQFK